MVHSTLRDKIVCDICIEDSKRYVECNVCNLNVCSKCFVRYQMDNSKEEIQCMKCYKTFEDDFIYDRLPKTILNNLRTRKKNLLFEKEKVFFPQAQYLAKFDKQINTVILPTIANIEGDLIKMERCILDNNRDSKTSLSMKMKYKAMVRSIFFLKTFANLWKSRFTIYNPSNPSLEEMITHYSEPEPYKLMWNCIPNEIKENKNLFNRNIKYLRNNFNKETKTKKLEHVFSCTEKKCNGFVMKLDWSCGICSTTYCKQCFRKNDADHVCLQENVDTAAFILKTSKPCPKCATRIHKISGCDQMFCTHCNTAFSWNTLEIETGIVHNPHFFEWQNRTDNALTCECNDGRVDIVHLVRHCESLYGFSFSSTLNNNGVDKISSVMYTNIKFLAYLLVVYRLALHIEAVEINRRFHNYDESQYFNIDLRIRYLNNEIDEAHYKKILHKRFKSKRVNVRRVQVFNLYNVVCTDILRRFLENNNDSITVQDQLYTEFSKLFAYINECFLTLSNMYNMNMPIVQITETESLNPRYKWTFSQDKLTGFLPMKRFSKVK